MPLAVLKYDTRHKIQQTKLISLRFSSKNKRSERGCPNYLYGYTYCQHSCLLFVSSKDI